MTNCAHSSQQHFLKGMYDLIGVLMDLDHVERIAASGAELFNWSQVGNVRTHLCSFELLNLET